MSGMWIVMRPYGRHSGCGSAYDITVDYRADGRKCSH